MAGHLSCLRPSGERPPGVCGMVCAGWWWASAGGEASRSYPACVGSIFTLV
jgi:hypothetical protein